MDSLHVQSNSLIGFTKILQEILKTKYGIKKAQESVECEDDQLLHDMRRVKASATIQKQGENILEEDEVWLCFTSYKWTVLNILYCNLHYSITFSFLFTWYYLKYIWSYLYLADDKKAF